MQRLGLVDYETTWHAMQALTRQRTPETGDELWLLQHTAVYTVGIAGRAAHLPRVDNGIPLVRTDRGGQVTYHGPGQTIAYLLIDMRRRGLSVRPLVRIMEQAVIGVLGQFGIHGEGRADAPGVYVGGAKIAALGLRIRQGCCYHGIALNVDMDLTPFTAIDPCGYAGLAVTQTRDLGIADSPVALAERLAGELIQRLSAAGRS